MTPRRPLRPVSRLLPLAALLAACGGSPAETQKDAVEIHAAAPQQLAGAVGTALPESLAVQVQSVAGASVAGVQVAWSVNGGGALSASSTRTDALGMARVLWTLGPAEGSQTATATISGAAPITFTARAAAPARLEKVSGDAQTAAAGTMEGEPLIVRVVDAAGAPVRAAPVAWEVTVGGGAATALVAVTDAAGLASARWQLGGLTIAQSMRASVGTAAPVTFAATATGILATTITATPVQLSLPAGSKGDVVVQVKDAAGQLLPDQTVSWSSSNTAIATVNTAGVVNALADGTATITVARDGKQATVAVTVLTTHPSGTRITSLTLSGRPHGVAVAANGAFFVSRIDAASVMRGTITADGESFVVAAAVGPSPAHVAVNASGTTAYTTNQYGNSVSVVDVGTNSTVATVPLSDGGFNLLVSPDGARVYATTANGILHVIDAASRSVVTTIPVGPAANGLAYAPGTNRLYVSSRDAATVTAIDALTNTVVRTYPVSWSPQRLAITADGSTLYIASEAVGLERLDLATGVRQTIPGVPAGSVGLALSPDGAQLYVTNPPAGIVTVVERATGAVVRTITAAAQPRNVAFDRSGTTAVIADEGGRVVFVR